MTDKRKYLELACSLTAITAICLLGLGFLLRRDGLSCSGLLLGYAALILFTIDGILMIIESIRRHA